MGRVDCMVESGQEMENLDCLAVETIQKQAVYYGLLSSVLWE
jgi:hypothetical protein